MGGSKSTILSTENGPKVRVALVFRGAGVIYVFTSRGVCVCVWYSPYKNQASKRVTGNFQIRII